ncbi:MAG: EamA family transporter [Verrucomicrobiota bacterium]
MTEANFWRLTFATLFLGLWAGFGGCGLGGVAFTTFFLSGVIGIGVGDAGLFQALPRLGPRLTVLLNQCLTVPIAALIEWLWLGTTLQPLQVFGVLVVLVGVGVALAPSEHVSIPRRQLISGVAFGLLAALGNAMGVVLSRKAYAIAHAHGETIDGGSAAFQRIIGGLLLAAVLMVLLKRRNGNSAAGATLVGMEKWKRIGPWVLLNSLAGQTLGVSAMQWSLETTPAGISMSIIALTPLAVIPLTRLFGGEKITVRSVLGGVIAVAGVICLTLTRLAASKAL